MVELGFCRNNALAMGLLGLLLAVAWSVAGAAEPVFRRHDLNPESSFCACAAVDVNHDGRLDVVCGGWWYEAPTWKKHFLREVETIRGRYDDYSCLPVDVNGDGWTDLVSANYRSEKLYWIEHPGAGLGPWKVHLIERPGPMETARLVDLAGDGRPAILPNGVKFAAWWELKSPGQWIRHDLPLEATGHGLGLGDINGDGRADIVTPRGWLEAPQDRARGTWRWHPELVLSRDCSVPILVCDVDGDGDNDLVWGRGHRTGLYWLEQVRNKTGQRSWTRHAIDTSWSQAHSLLLADLDNDGRPELIAGKRYLGHEGHDLGEYDPLGVYWYRFDRPTSCWRRGTISEGGPAGIGLDPKAVDLDGDGDTDLVLADRSGLCWLENLLVSKTDPRPGSKIQEKAPPQYADHARLLVCREGSVERPISTPGQWGLRRSHILAQIETVMGPLPGPSRRVPLDVKILEEVRLPRYTRKKLTYAAEPGDRVPAYLLIPHNLTGPAPAMLCLHQTTSIGKGEPAGLGGLPNLHYADELAAQGYVCIVPDYPSFGDYRYDFKAHGKDYASGSMKAIWNNLRAVDLLETLREVDPDRIGCIGHSLGGHNSLFTAVFDQRIRAVITSCGFTAFADYYRGNLAGWTSDRYMPRIRDLYGNSPAKMAFDFYEVLGAIAPRPVFVNAPLHDGNFELAGVRKVAAAVTEVYRLFGMAANLRVENPDCGHDFPEPVRREVYAWLRRALK